MTEPCEEALLRRELAEARQTLEAMRQSLRFQLGDAIVAGMSGRMPASRRIKLLWSAWQRAQSLRLRHKIKSALFSGLPGYGLPPDSAAVPRSELRALDRYVAKLGQGPASGADWRPSDPWVSAAASLAREFRDAIDRGFPRPARASVPIGSTRAGRRVVYISQHDPRSATNGYARRTSEIVAHLTAAGVDVAIAVPGWVGGGEPSNSPEGSYYRLSLPSPSPRGLKGYVDAMADEIGRAARAHRADLIHAASNYLNGLAALSAARMLGIPCVYEVRGLWQETRVVTDPGFGTTLGYALQARMEAFCAEGADAVVASSSGIAEELRRRGAKAEFVLAPSGAPDTRPPDAALATRLRALFPEGSRVLGFVGSLTAYEGFETLARALARLVAADSRYRLLVVGDGPHSSETRAAFAREGLAGAVAFTGKMSLRDARSAYGAIDLAVYPRDRTRVTDLVESLKPVEALAARVPVVLSELAPWNDLIGNCPAVFATAPGDAPALAAAVERFFGLPAAERQRLGESGALWVAQHRSWADTAARIKRVYDGLGQSSP